MTSKLSQHGDILEDPQHRLCSRLPGKGQGKRMGKGKNGKGKKRGQRERKRGTEERKGKGGRD